MKEIPTLYLLAADQDYRLLRTHGDGLAEIAHRKADDFSDVNYRFPNEQSRNRSVGISFDVNPRGIEDEQERHRFAKHVAAALAAEWARGGHDRIVISAGPKMLGVLRDVLPKALQPHIAAELHKDLVKIPLHDLPSHFKDVSAV